MICFICKISVDTFSELAFHYKCMYFLDPLSTYECSDCSESNCSQTFQNFNDFIIRAHTNSSKLTSYILMTLKLIIP